MAAESSPNELDRVRVEGYVTMKLLSTMKVMMFEKLPKGEERRG